MLDSPTIPAPSQNPPDYRTFLRNIRPPIRPPLSCSEDDSNDDDEEDDEHADDVTINDRLELDQNPCEEESTMTSNDPEEALSQLGSLRGSHAILKINITEQKIIKCYRVNIFENIWTIKQRIIQSLSNKPSFAFNYGLFSPKTGRFLFDHRQIVEYIAAGTIVPYEFRYKRRVFHVVIKNRKDSRKLVKMQNVAKQRELMTCVQQRNCDKLHSLIKKGVDPNFHQEDGEETPLTMVATMAGSEAADARSLMTSSGGTEKRRRSFLRSSSLRKSWSRSMANLHQHQQHPPPPLTPVLLALVGAGGAHLDFRNRHGFTPLHVAARSGNTSALKSLLELGASPDVVDMKGLTPLYHCCSMNVADDECVSVLLRHKATIDCVDSQKWNVLHQMCRYGHLDHLCVFLQRIKSSVDQEDRLLLNSQNATGNTPLHVCALYNQEFCLLTLLDHGADPSVRNFANQDPFQVAIVGGNANLAKLITEYPDMQKHGHQVPSHRATSGSVGPAMTSAVETSSSSSPNRRHTFTPATFMKKEGKPKSSTSTTDMTSRVDGEAKRRQEPKIMNPANSKLQRYDTDLPPNATLPRSSILYQSSKKSSPKKQTPPSDTSNLMYIALEDYNPGQEQEDHLALSVGDRVSVSPPKSASDLYCLGTIGDRSGLVPLRCLQPVQLRRPFNQSATTTSVETPFSKLQLQGEDDDGTNKNSSNNNNRPKEMRPLPKKEEKKQPSHHASVAQHKATDDGGASSVVHKYKNVIINRGDGGYGFVLRGTKANGEELQGKFQPNSRNPGLQYLESVDPNGAAHVGGLRAGDVILKVNGTDVRFMGHGQIVEFIRKCGRTLHMHVASVITQDNSGTSVSMTSPSPTMSKRPVSCLIPPPPAIITTSSSSDVTQAANGGFFHPHQRHTRTGSVVSAISKLDNVIASESGKLSDSDDVVADSATLRRRPGSRQIRPSELQDIFLRKTAKQQDQQQQGEAPYNNSKAATLSRQLIKVTTPTLPNKETPSPHRTTSTSSVFTNDTTSSASQSPSTSSPHHNRPSSQLFQDELLATIKRGPKKKLPPPPPKRTDSKLSVSGAPSSDNKEEPEKLTGAQIAASVEESIRNRIQSSSSREPPQVKSKLKAAELKKARAASTSQIDSNTEVTCSPLELALKAKKQSLNRQDTEDTPMVTNSLVKPSDVKMQKPPRLNKPLNHNSTKKSETFDLPPPPAPVQDLQNELFNHPRFGASVDLPPPPDEAVLNSPDTFSVMPSSVELPPPPPLTFSKNSGGGDISSLLPPATSFVDGHTAAGKMDTSSSGSVIETSSNTDSGIEPNQLHHQTIETGSIISTISSEDGSDFGVSMAFDKSEAGGSAKQAYLELIKKHNQHQPPQPPPVVNNNKVVVANQPPPVTSHSSVDGKPLATWTVQDVGDWLRGLGLGVHVPAFAENEIAGSHLPDLGKDELAELGVKRIGHRLTIEKSLKQHR